MPVQYTSQIAEHHAVRRSAGLFDVSHMCAVDLKGARVRQFLQHLLANDVARLKLPGKALYSCMLNEAGGVLDDLIVYFLNEAWFRLVVNAGTRDKDLAWIRSTGRPFDIEVTERTDLAILAVQGPEGRAKATSLLSASGADAALALAPFFGREIDGWFVSRTGYTGEDGFELMMPASQAARAWRELNAAGVVSCGLGARDTLRLEAGMNLYGNDMDESTHPFESGLAWTVAMQPDDRRFIGRAALESVTPSRQLIGLVLEDRGILRSHQKVFRAARMTARSARSPAAPSLQLSSARLRSRAYPRALHSRCRSISAESFSMHGW